MSSSIRSLSAASDDFGVLPLHLVRIDLTLRLIVALRGLDLGRLPRLDSPG